MSTGPSGCSASAGGGSWARRSATYASLPARSTINGVPAALSFVLERWHDRLRGGQIIDLRPGAEQVARRDPGLVYGLVIVHAVDGTATIRIHEPKSQTLELVQAVIAALGGLVGAGIDTVRAKAAEALGDQASITCGGAEAADTDPAGP